MVCEEFEALLLSYNSELKKRFCGIGTIQLCWYRYRTEIHNLQLKKVNFRRFFVERSVFVVQKFCGKAFGFCDFGFFV